MKKIFSWFWSNCADMSSFSLLICDCGLYVWSIYIRQMPATWQVDHNGLSNFNLMCAVCLWCGEGKKNLGHRHKNKIYTESFRKISFAHSSQIWLTVGIDTWKVEASQHFEENIFWDKKFKMSSESDLM